MLTPIAIIPSAAAVLFLGGFVPSMLHRLRLLFCRFLLFVRLVSVLCHCAIRLVLRLICSFDQRDFAGFFLMIAELLC